MQTVCLELISSSVWDQIINSLNTVRSVFTENKTISAGLRSFTLNLLASVTEKIGWDFGSKEGFLTGQLRVLLITTAANAGHRG